MWLETNGCRVAAGYRHDAEVFVESAGLILGSAGPDEMVAQPPGVGRDLQVDLVRQLWRVDSSFIEPVLQALAPTAPPVLSTAARRALSSFRSAGKG